MRRWTVECICTDRGQHKRTWMARMIWHAPFDPTPEEQDSYRRALEANMLQTLAASRIAEAVARLGQGGWTSFLTPEGHKHAMFGPPLHDAEPGGAVSRESYGFACSRCDRWPRINKDRWIALMDGARAAGISEFDVSYLD